MPAVESKEPCFIARRPAADTFRRSAFSQASACCQCSRAFVRASGVRGIGLKHPSPSIH